MLITIAQPLTTQLLMADRRRSERADMEADTLMTDREGRLSGIRLLNLSEDGFMAVTDVDQRQREPIRVDMPIIGWVRADIVWVLGERIGAAFRQPIPAHLMAAIVRDVQS
jgi:hypothetical protein